MSEMNEIHALLSRLRAIPEHIACLVEGRSESDLHARPEADMWSAAEILAHLRASDDIVSPRIYQILVRNSPPLVGYDERR